MRLVVALLRVRATTGPTPATPWIHFDDGASIRRPNRMCAFPATRQSEMPTLSSDGERRKAKGEEAGDRAVRRRAHTSAESLDSVPGNRPVAVDTHLNIAFPKVKTTSLCFCKTVANMFGLRKHRFESRLRRASETTSNANDLETIIATRAQQKQQLPEEYEGLNDQSHSSRLFSSRNAAAVTR